MEKCLLEMKERNKSLTKASLKKRMKTRGFKKTEEGKQMAQDKKSQKLQRKQVY